MGEIYIGNNISIDNTGNKKAKITKINGGDRQETRSGKNKLQLYFSESTKNGVTISENEDGSITLNGTATTSINFMDLGKFLYEVDKGNFKGCITYKNGSVTGAAGLYFSDSTTLGNNKGGVQLNSSNKSFDLNTDVTEDINIYPYIYVNQGVVFNNYTFYFQVINSEVADFEYEKYGAMPSPDYPSEVETVGSNVNEFDKSAEIVKKYIDASGNEVEIVNESFYKQILIPKTNKYIMSFKEKVGSGYVRFSYYNGDTFISREIGNTNNYIFTVPEGTTKIDIRTDTETNYFTELKIEQGKKATVYSPYGMGSVEIENVNKNFIKIQEMNKTEIGLDISTNKNVVNINGTATSGTNIYNFFEDIKLKKGTYTFSFISQNAPAINSCQFVFRDENNAGIVTLNGWGETNAKTVTLEKDTVISSEKSSFYTNKNITFSNTKYELQIEKGESATEIIEPQSQTKIMPIQQEMLEGDYIEDVEHHEWGKVVLDGTENINLDATYQGISQFTLNNITNGKFVDDGKTISVLSNYFKGVIWSYSWTKDNSIVIRNDGRGRIMSSEFTTAEQFKTFLQEQYSAGTPVIVYYKLATPIDLGLTPEQSNVAYQLENIELFDGMNYITATSSIDPELEVTVENPVEDYKIQISSDGYLIIPELNIKYLIDLNESNIPIMPEATESSVRAAGRDGDIVLNTTYEPITFDIVCYTEDNLTYSEKINAEKNMNRFLNSIKNKTIEIAFEKNSSFYKVKYSGALVTTNFPKHLKFAIPLKSSDSYGKDLIQKSIVGNATGESNTIEEVGAVFVIKGPALNPIISLNDYSMEYTTSILEGARVEIDSNKSTITNINNDGVKTNVMKYYNHQFPKIQNGTNTLKILSGIDNDKNVIVMWNDLKL